MAAASGQTQDTSPQKGLPPEKRNLFIGLGIAGLLLLGGGGYFLMSSMGGSSPDAATTTASATNSVSSGSPSPDAALTAGGPGVGDGTAGMGDGTTTPGVSTVAAGTKAKNGEPLRPSRSDPFQQAYLIPTPLPPVPPPVDVPALPSMELVEVPGSRVKFADLEKPLKLPPVDIFQQDPDRRRPVDAFPPRRSSTDSNAGQLSPSLDKRLSGVVIGDGIRALLEITPASGGTPIVHNVQPGDEVDGITILNIQRFKEGGNTVTRMLIRENGEEKTVDLRPSPQPMTAGGAGGLGGLNPMMPGMPPGMGGMDPRMGGAPLMPNRM